MAAFSLQGAANVAAEQDQGTDVTLRDQYGDELKGNDDKPVIARVAGTLSSIYRKAEDAQRERLFKRGRSAATLTADAYQRQQLELIAACVLSWNLCDGDKPIPCTKDNVVQVLTVAPWIRTEIESAMVDPARFLR